MEETNNQQKEEYEIIRERIKTRPINRKKLFRRTVITAAMAVIFGVLACITFLVLEPIFSNLLTPEDEPTPEVVEIPLDKEEILPRDMKLEDEEPVTQTQIIVHETGEKTTALENYNSLYNELSDLYRTEKRSVVTVTGVNQDVDWFNNSYESKGTTSGLIVANNGIELLILTDFAAIDGSENIKITFYNDITVEGTIKETDKNTGLAVVAIQNRDLPDVLLDEAIIANLGNSRTNRLLASPVIAIGHPLGNVDSVEYGMVTSKNNIINKVDNNYELLTTDMPGNSKSNGVVFNLSGEVVGLIYQKASAGEISTISLLGISDIKKSIERMSNGNPRAYLGVIGTDVTLEAVDKGVPIGAYVTGIDMDSPAMTAGIQSGDVVVSIDEYEITTYAVLTEAILAHNPGEEANIRVKRMNGEEYSEVTISVQLGELR